MATYMGGETSTWEKVMYVALGLLVLATIASVPQMVADREAREAAEWKAKKCMMYADDKLTEVPAKCNYDFVDHEERSR